MMIFYSLKPQALQINHYHSSFYTLRFSFSGLVLKNQSNPYSICAYSSHCAGISPTSLWITSSNISITMNVNSTACNLSSTPAYFTTISGSGFHFYLQSYHAIYTPTNHGFRIYARGGVSPMTSSTLLGYASSYTWNVNWLGKLSET